VTTSDTPAQAHGPYFEELTRGQRFTSAPAMTLTAGAAAVHQSILGDRLRLSLDEELAARMSRRAALLAHPALVWNVAIGQSTSATQNVVANLFYRGLAFQRAPAIGDTLHTLTEVVGLRQNTARPGRPATGLAALEIVTLDQHGRLVLNFWRCAMLPLRDPNGSTSHDDDLTQIGAAVSEEQLTAAVDGWDLSAAEPVGGSPCFDDLRPGNVWLVQGGDVVSSAPELARLTLNVAAVHHDGVSRPEGRLVYGGHTIGLALAQACRALPNLLTVMAWHGCDHTGPVHEGDTLFSSIEVERVEPLRDGAGLVHLRSRVSARRTREESMRAVLDWRYVALML
jgi:acyl dehydratase